MTDFLTKEWWQQATLADVKAKIAARENLNARDKAGISPLILAASYSSDAEIIKTLLENGAELAAKDWITGSVLANAAKYNPHPEIIKTLVQAGADVNEEDIVGEMTPLMQAAKYNTNPEVIKELLEHGADTGMRDEQNKTAFDYFERADEYPEIKKLLEVKEDVSDDKEGVDIALADMAKRIEFSQENKGYFAHFMSENLTPREERVLRMRFGIGMNMAQTLEEVGNQFNVTRERIRQIEAKALRKMMYPERWQKIEYLPYWGNSPEEKLLRCLHLLISERRRSEEPSNLHLGYKTIDEPIDVVTGGELVTIQGQCKQTEEFAISLMQSVLDNNDGYVLLLNAPDFRCFQTTIFDDSAADDDKSLLKKRLDKTRILKRDTAIIDAKTLQNSLPCWLNSEKYKHLCQQRLLAIFASLPRQWSTNEAYFMTKLKELAKNNGVPAFYLQDVGQTDYGMSDILFKLNAVNGYQEPVEIGIISAIRGIWQTIRSNEGCLKYSDSLKNCKHLWFYETNNEQQ